MSGADACLERSSGRQTSGRSPSGRSPSGRLPSGRSPTRALSDARFGWKLRSRSSFLSSVSGFGPPLFDLTALTAEQKAMIQQAREVYLAAGGDLDPDVYEAEPFLARFLVFAKWKFDKAAKQLRAAAEWRKSSGANDIRRKIACGLKLCEFPHFVTFAGAVVFLPLHGQARNGDVLTFQYLGSLDPGRFLSVMSDADFYELNIYLLEMAAVAIDRLSVASGVLVRVSTVVDCNGMGMKHVAPKILSRIKKPSALPDLYYPDLIGCAIVVNAPWAFNVAWSMLKTIISKELQKRVAIVSSGSSADTLLKLAEPELIPCISPGGRCAAMPRSVAAMHGFDSLNVEQLAALMVNRPEAFGSRAAGAYAIEIEAQGQGVEPREREAAASEAERSLGPLEC